MKLSFHTKHRSIKALDEIDLPDFTLLVGLNGSGKSHLLDAIVKGAVKAQIGAHAVPLADMRMIGFRDITLQDVRAHDVETSSQQRKKLVAMRPQVREVAIESITEIYRNHGLEAVFTDESILSKAPEIARTTMSVDQHTAFESELFNHCMSLAHNFQSAFVDSRGMDHRMANGIVEQLQERVGRPLVDLTVSELQWGKTLLNANVPLFANSFSELFGNYRKLQERNRFLTFSNAQYKSNHTVLSESEFTDVVGAPPWEVANELLKSAAIPVRFEEPPEEIDGQYSARAIHIDSGDPIPFTDLSSGEQVLMALTMAIWGKSDSRHAAQLPKVLLLDEVDAPLHASMIRSFVAMIRETLVGEFGVKVVLATHSASTVAICGEENVYERRANDPKLHLIPNDEAIRNLTSGIPTLSVKVENRRPVFVESDNDVRYYELLSEALSGYLTEVVFNLNFMSTASKKGSGDLTGCERVISIVQKLNDVGIGQVRGLVDRDNRSVSSSGLVLLGGNERYAIENFVLDPLMIGLFLIKMKFFSQLGLEAYGLSDERDTWGGVIKGDLVSIQGIVDGILTKTGLSNGPLVAIELVGGLTVNVTEKFCEQNGHDWEELLKKTFPELNQYTQQAKLKLMVIEHVWMAFPGFAPASVLTTLKTLAS